MLSTNPPVSPLQVSILLSTVEWPALTRVVDPFFSQPQAVHAGTKSL